MKMKWMDVRSTIVPMDTSLLIRWKTNVDHGICAGRLGKYGWYVDGVSGYEIERDFSDEEVTHWAFLPEDPDDEGEK